MDSQDKKPTFSNSSETASPQQGVQERQRKYEDAPAVSASPSTGSSLDVSLGMTSLATSENSSRSPADLSQASGKLYHPKHHWYNHPHHHHHHHNKGHDSAALQYGDQPQTEQTQQQARPPYTHTTSFPMVSNSQSNHLFPLLPNPGSNASISPYSPAQDHPPSIQQPQPQQLPLQPQSQHEQASRPQDATSTVTAASSDFASRVLGRVASGDTRSSSKNSFSTSNEEEDENNQRKTLRYNWTDYEDRLLLKIILSNHTTIRDSRYKPLKRFWELVAELIKKYSVNTKVSRTHRQCRERFYVLYSKAIKFAEQLGIDPTAMHKRFSQNLSFTEAEELYLKILRVLKLEDGFKLVVKSDFYKDQKAVEELDKFVSLGAGAKPDDETTVSQISSKSSEEEKNSPSINPRSSQKHKITQFASRNRDSASKRSKHGNTNDNISASSDSIPERSPLTQKQKDTQAAERAKSEDVMNSLALANKTTYSSAASSISIRPGSADKPNDFLKNKKPRKSKNQQGKESTNSTASNGTSPYANINKKTYVDNSSSSSIGSGGSSNSQGESNGETEESTESNENTPLGDQPFAASADKVKQQPLADDDLDDDDDDYDEEDDTDDFYISKRSALEKGSKIGTSASAGSGSGNGSSTGDQGAISIETDPTSLTSGGQSKHKLGGSAGISNTTGSTTTTTGGVGATGVGATGVGASSGAATTAVLDVLSKRMDKIDTNISDLQSSISRMDTQMKGDLSDAFARISKYQDGINDNISFIISELQHNRRQNSTGSVGSVTSVNDESGEAQGRFKGLTEDLIEFKNRIDDRIEVAKEDLARRKAEKEKIGKE